MYTLHIVRILLRLRVTFFNVYTACVFCENGLPYSATRRALLFVRAHFLVRNYSYCVYIYIINVQQTQNVGAMSSGILAKLWAYVCLLRFV